MTGPRRRRPLVRSVRVRTTLAAVAVVAVVLSAGSVVLLAALGELLSDELVASARSRAAEIAAMSQPAAGRLPVGDLEDDVVQLVGPDGAVVAASPNVTGLPPIVWPPGREPVEVVGPVDAEPMLAVAHHTGRHVLLVARTTESRDDALAVLGRLLAVGMPAVLVLVAGLTWLLVGRALRPAEEIRRQVDRISSAALDRRVPEPDGSDEVARLARTMNRMLDRLERAQYRQRRFTADASHELRTPLATIRQAAEVALAHPDRTGVADLARTVLTEELRVQRLVEDLLLLARSDERGLHLRADVVDLDDVVFDEARRLRAAHPALTVDTARVSAGRIVGDVEALRRILANLGDNAARHAAGAVAFGLGESPSGVRLTVDDDGPGIPAAERERVLGRFVRLDASRGRSPDRGGGAGLGLAIVAELVAAHGGTLHILDAPSGGARVELTFPQREAPGRPEPGARRVQAPFSADARRWADGREA